MIETYPLKRNPICPYDRADCNNQDLDGYTDCTNCLRFGNGAEATGGMPDLERIVKFAKEFFRF